MNDPKPAGRWREAEDDDQVMSAGGMLYAMGLVLGWLALGIVLPPGSMLATWHDALALAGVAVAACLGMLVHGFARHEGGDAALGGTGLVLLAPLLFINPLEFDFRPHMLPLVFVVPGVGSVFWGLAHRDEDTGRAMVRGGIAVIGAGLGLYALLYAVDRFIVDVDAWIGRLIDVLPEE